MAALDESPVEKNADSRHEPFDTIFGTCSRASCGLIGDCSDYIERIGSCYTLGFNLRSACAANSGYTVATPHVSAANRYMRGTFQRDLSEYGAYWFEYILRLPTERYGRK